MKFYKYLFIILILSTTFFSDCLAQNRQIIDSLVSVAQNTNNDTLKIKAYKDICWEYATTRIELDTAKMYADSIYNLSTKINYEDEIALSHFYYGLIDRFKGNYYDGIEHIEKFIDHSEGKGDSSRIATGLFQFAVMHSNLGNYRESLDAYYRTLNIHKSTNNKDGIGFTLHSIGNIQRKLEKHSDAVKSYNQSIVLKKETGDITGIWMSLASLGNTYSELNEYSKAESYYLEGIPYAQQAKNEYGIAYIKENMGNLYNQMNNHNKALTFHKDALSIREKSLSKDKIAYSQHKVGETYLKLGDLKNAKSYLFQSLAISEMLKLKPLLQDTYKSIVTLYELENDFKNAFKYQKLHTKTKDSVFNTEKNKQLLEIETKYQTAQKDQEIALLTKENELKEKEVQRQDDIKNAILFGSVLTLLLAALLIYILRQRLKNQKVIAAKDEEIKISKLKEQLGTLEMKALRAQMNPHFLFNCMNSINTMILSDDADNASKYLTKFSKLVRLMLENSEAQKVTLQDELDMLKTYIELEAIRFNGKINYSIHVDESLDKSTVLIPSMILQPFVENAIWHGLLPKDKEGEIGIKIKEKEEHLQCSITDNGIGREASMNLKKDSKLKKKSMGIKITTDRLKLLTKEKIKDVIHIIDLKDQHSNVQGTQVDILIPIS
jgi:sensor histidine kinase YesM